MSVAEYRSVRQRLWNPPNAKWSSELDVVTEKERRRQSIARDVARLLYPQWSAEATRHATEQGFNEWYGGLHVAITLPNISRVVCRYYGITREHMKTQRRTLNVVRPRQIIMYLAKKHIGLSYPVIGQKLGGMDHTTVLHGARTIKRLMITELRLAAEIENFERFFRVYREEAA